jgi:hypothetical protein
MDKIDDRISEDLIYLFQGKKIKRAADLSRNMEMPFSTRGEPAHFFGDRNASTVMVMLNPGCDAEIADKKFKEVSKNWDRTSLKDFIKSYKQTKIKGTKCESEKGKLDSFDVKQSVFLKSWYGCEIDFPRDYESKENKLKACECVLQQKLQLELVPFASRTFTPNANQRKYLIPYLNDCLEEIFSKERKYVVFCGSVFERLLKNIGSEEKFSVRFSGERKMNLSGLNNNGKGMTARCRVFLLEYKGKKQRALIAHTFASQALTNAYELMGQYGKFCYTTFKGAKF